MASQTAEQHQLSSTAGNHYQFQSNVAPLRHSLPATSLGPGSTQDGNRDSKSWALRIVWIKAPEHELNSTNSQTPKGALMLQTIASRAASCKYLKISLRRLTTTLVWFTKTTQLRWFSPLQWTVPTRMPVRTSARTHYHTAHRSLKVSNTTALGGIKILSTPSSCRPIETCPVEVRRLSNCRSSIMHSSCPLGQHMTGAVNPMPTPSNLSKFSHHFHQHSSSTVSRAS